MSIHLTGRQIGRLVREKFSAAELMAYRTSALVNGVVLAVAFVLCVVVLVLTDADPRGGQVVATAAGTPNRSTLRAGPPLPAATQVHKQ